MQTRNHSPPTMHFPGGAGVKIQYKVDSLQNQIAFCSASVCVIKWVKIDTAYCLVYEVLRNAWRNSLADRAGGDSSGVYVSLRMLLYR